MSYVGELEQLLGVGLTDLNVTNIHQNIRGLSCKRLPPWRDP